MYQIYIYTYMQLCEYMHACMHTCIDLIGSKWLFLG